ncbi:MAG: aminotransferase class I/II-fold pyridoxal phosphate-dependent enzyme [Acidobacteriota bacterium]
MSDASSSHRRLATRLVHPPRGASPKSTAAVNPIHRSTVWGLAPESLEAGVDGVYADLVYPRYNNLPNQQALASQMADLEHAEAALVTASGMSAISSAILAVVSSGDHVLAQTGLYGGTHGLLTRLLPDYGVSHDFVDGNDPAGWRGKLRPTTKVFYVETLANPLLDVPDLGAAARFAAEHDLVAIIDNTFATPLAFRPLDHGFHLVVHSATKYLNGHSDVLAGVVAGGGARVAAAESRLKLLGGSLDPQAAYLLARGVKTLGLRVPRQSENALALARHLEGHPAVVSVRYPGLESHPHHARAAELFDGYGAMLAMELAGGFDAASRFLAGVRLATHGASLGGVETLVVSPAKSSHAAMPADERRAVGIADGTVRVSVGIEAIEDLVVDFDQALGGAASP